MMSFRHDPVSVDHYYMCVYETELLVQVLGMVWSSFQGLILNSQGTSVLTVGQICLKHLHVYHFLLYCSHSQQITCGIKIYI